MSVDNRVDINDCEDDTTNFSTTGSGGALGTNTTAGQRYEGAASVEGQHSNVFDDTTTSADSANTALALDLSDATTYLLLKDSLVETFANLGAMIVIGDGTDRIGYKTGGNDAPGFPLIPYYVAFKLDVNFAAANPGTDGVDHNSFAGSEVNLDQTNITDFGIGTLHLAKAVGTVPNIFMDAFCYIANAHPNYALTINVGSSGTPETMADVQSDDAGGLLTGLGYGGMVNNPKGSEFGFFAPTEWGDSSTGSITAFADAGGGSTTVTSNGHGMVNGTEVTITGTTSYNGTFTTAAVATNTFDIVRAFVADDATGTWGAGSYFTANDEQWFWIGDNQGGHAVGATHFPMRIVGNATGNNDVKWTSVVIVNTGTRSQFIAGSPDVEIMQFEAVSFTDTGTIDFTTQSAGNRFANNCIFNNCDQITFSSLDADNCTFNGTTDANGAVLWSTTGADLANQDNFTFNSDGTGHAIEISLNTASLTTYNIDGYLFDGYAYDDGTAGNRIFLIDNLLDGDVTINLTNSDAINQSSGTAGIFSFEAAAGYTGTVTIQQAVTLTLTGIETDSEVRIINLDDTINFNKELSGAEQISGSVQSVIIDDGGSGYSVGDDLTAVGGTGSAATFNVDTIDGGGAVTSVSILGGGSYTANPPTPTTTTVAPAGGTGATLRLDISGEHQFAYDGGLGVNVAIIVFHLNFKEVRIEQILPAVSSSIPIQQTTDRVFSNP